MKIIRELPNKKYGRLTLEGLPFKENGLIWYLCRCDCGTLKKIVKVRIESGHIKSCGCLMKDYISPNKSHGMSKTKIYHTYHDMISRCYNPKNKEYKNYGARGIAVCESWKEGFVNFYNDIGDQPQGMTLERINNNGGYKPDNCRWATRKEQLLNQRRNRNITYKGKTQPLSVWCEELGLLYFRTHGRLTKLGYSIPRAFSPFALRRTTNG